MSACVQEQWAPHNACFGCGPANAQGLRVRSFEADGGLLVATWTPQPHHEAFPGVLNGGIVGALLDCHCNWAAAMHLKAAQGAATPPCTVTADYTISLKRPCPTDGPLSLEARVAECVGPKCVVEGTMRVGGKFWVICWGTFVAVELGHPVYHRW